MVFSVFKNVFKGTDLEFNLSLEKTDYKPGDTVRGLVVLNTRNGAKARQLILFAKGKESTIINVGEESGTYVKRKSWRWSTGIGSGTSSSNRCTYTEVNNFFAVDLSHLLQKSVITKNLQDRTVEILPQTKEIAFDFALPTDNKLFSSYEGKHANITYTMKVTADITKRLDVNKEANFSVFNPDNSKVELYSSRTDIPSNEGVSESELSSSASIRAEPTNDDKGKESYASRFDRIFGKQMDTATKNRDRYITFHGRVISFDLGTIFAKGREKFLKESSEARIEILNHENDDTGDNENEVYFPGQILRGKVVVPSLQNPEEEETKKNIRGLRITLTGIEHANAGGLQRVTTIEKHEKDVDIISSNGENDINFPFEFQIPNQVRQSYIGKYSEYFWGLEAKVNIAWSSDITARKIIEIA